MRHQSQILVSIVSLAIAAAKCLGDGGVPIAAMDVNGHRCTLIMSPATPEIGPVSFTLLGRSDLPAMLYLQPSPSATPIGHPMVTDARTPGVHVQTQFTDVGPCQVWIEFGDPSGTSPRVELFVNAAPPAWQVFIPWIFCWIPLAGLLAVRAGVVRSTNYTSAMRGTE